MHIIGEFLDNQYPKKDGQWHTREISRAIVYRDDGKFAVHRIKRDDSFGKWTYFETPGGGIDEKESPEEAAIRECQEELGYDIEIIEPIGIIKDQYALIGRNNINYYFLARQKKIKGKHLVSDGDSLIDKTLYLPIDKIIELYENMPNEMIPLLLKRRELSIWKMAKKLYLLKKATLSLDKISKLH